jgi:hypothetical protein
VPSPLELANATKQILAHLTSERRSAIIPSFYSTLLCLWRRIIPVTLLTPIMTSGPDLLAVPYNLSRKWQKVFTLLSARKSC